MFAALFIRYVNVDCSRFYHVYWVIWFTFVLFFFLKEYNFRYCHSIQYLAKVYYANLHSPFHPAFSKGEWASGFTLEGKSPFWRVNCQEVWVIWIIYLMFSFTLRRVIHLFQLRLLGDASFRRVIHPQGWIHSPFLQGESSLGRLIHPSKKVIHPSKRVNRVNHPSKGEWKH